jgi:hypothetical protein
MALESSARIAERGARACAASAHLMRVANQGAAASRAQCASDANL